MKKQKDQKLHPAKNPRMYHLKDGSSPISVLSTISGSLPLHALIFFIIFDLIQMCGGAPVKPDTRQNDCPSTTNYLVIIGVMGAGLLLFFCFFCWYIYKGGDGGSRPAGDPSPRSYEATPVSPRPTDSENVDALTKQKTETSDLISPRPTDSEIVATLTKQKIETSNLRQALLSRLKETEEEIEKCDEYLQSVENELDKGATNCDELIRNKERLLESKRRLYARQTDTDEVRKHTEKVLQLINNTMSKR